MPDLTCAHCGLPLCNLSRNSLWRARTGHRLFCNKACFYLSRRNPNPPSEPERKKAKAAYDAEYRKKNAEVRAAQKREWFKKNYDPEKARVARKKRMPQHVEYCRRPEYKEWKSKYDIERHAEQYADFAECWRLLIDLEKEIRSQATAYERRVANGYYLRTAQKRRRELWQLKQRQPN